jgi:hypothetical protein
MPDVQSVTSVYAPNRMGLTMKGLGGFFKENWYSLGMTIAFMAGAVYSLGFQAQKQNQLYDRVHEIKQVQSTKIQEFDNVKRDVDLLKWNTTQQRDNVEQIKMDVRSIDKRTQEMEKRMEVVIELLKPRQQ